MNTQAVIALALVIVSAVVTDALSVGFDVDTPLDPFLGGLSKIKRHIVRRIKDLSNDDNFVNACPTDQLNMLFGQPQLLLPPFLLPQSQQRQAQPAPLIPMPAFNQRKSLSTGQIPMQLMQQLDAQLASLAIQLQRNAQQPIALPKRNGPILPELLNIRQVPNFIHQLAAAPMQFAAQFPAFTVQQFPQQQQQQQQTQQQQQQRFV